MTTNQTIDGVPREPVAWAVEISGCLKFFEQKKSAENARRRYEKVMDAERLEPFPLFAEQPAPVAVVPDRDTLRDIIAQAVGGDAYDCLRVWSAWGVGTMSDDDFIPIVDQEERLFEIADACLDELKRLNPSL
ncbi:hypothetical protein GCM10008969_44690 [Pseudomonas veronii subsp. inensis]|uniref:hypothetical protein n=1 Tax=Pseudomonas veronii TaxID=76761 RepID=UPI0031F85C1D